MDRAAAKENFERLSEAHNEQVNIYKRMIQDKEEIIEENVKII